jgi:hypothetical protein
LAQAVALLYHFAKLALSAESCILCRTPFPGILALLVLVEQFFGSSTQSYGCLDLVREVQIF